MAETGCKLSDFSGTLPHGSAEDVAHFCDPCLTTGHQVAAYKYCVDCEEYLCRNCADCHLKTKASRNHQLVDKDKVGKQPSTQGSDVCTEKCPEHEQEVIKCFCPQHEALGCHICMILYHKTCEVDYIPDKCVDIANSDEYRRTVFRLYLKLQELDKITQTTKEREQEIDECHHNLLQEIIKFRKEINDYLDQLQQKFQKEVDKKKAEDKQITQKILDGCNRLSLDIKEMQSTLQTYETTGKFGQLYIKVKQAQSVLKSNEIKAEDGLERTAQQYIFERNSSFMNTLSKLDGFGKLCLTSVLKTPRRGMQYLHKLSKKEDINVRTNSDTYDCWITGCAALSSNKIVLADNRNEKLKLVNIHTKPTVVEEISLDCGPWGVAVLSQDQIAVTMPFKEEVAIMTCGDRLSTVRTISVRGECRGVTYNHGQLYVVCQNPFCVLMLDKQGSVLNRIYLNKEIFLSNYIEVSENSKHIYISNYLTENVIRITLRGEVTAVFKCKNLVGPEGMLMTNDGSLLVCCSNNTIYHISGDLKQGRELIDDIAVPYSICYNHHLHEVYIGGSSDVLTVLIPQ